MGCIHNLPDFVYFNHSQHVTVAGIECQTCHGPLKYEIQKQFAPLTMAGVLIVTEKPMKGMNIIQKFMKNFLKIRC
jgi:hypothetical protein